MRHVAAERAVAPGAERLHERKNQVAHGAEHLLGFLVAEVLPPEIGIRRFDARVLLDDADALLEDGVLQRRAEKIGVALLHDLVVVQELHENEERDLLHDRERIRHSV